MFSTERTKDKFMDIKNDFEWTKQAGKFLSTKEHILLIVGKQDSKLDDFSVDW